MIEVVKRVGDIARLHSWLETHVRGHLKPDVSKYAQGRLRAWLGVEPTLTSPTRLLQGMPVERRYLERLAEIIGWQFDYCLATYSGDVEAKGITAHRDASYADYEGWGLNVSGEAEFKYWEGRQSFGYSPCVREYTAQDPPTQILTLKPGDVTRFNVKNLHAATPGAKRWALNFWRGK